MPTRRTVLIGPNDNDSFHVPPQINGLWIPGDHYHGQNPGEYQIAAGERARLSSLSVLAYVAGFACHDPAGYCDPKGVGAHLIVRKSDNFETNIVNISFRDGDPESVHYQPDYYQFWTIPAPGVWIAGPFSWRVVLYNANPISRPDCAVNPADHRTHQVFTLHGLWEVEPMP